MKIPVLFAETDGVYFRMPEVEPFDIERDARTWQGGCAVVAHPPCAQWGAFARRARPDLAEKDLAPWAVQQVRRWGGVLEHPAGSALWRACGLPRPGEDPDQHGGFTLSVAQFCWGHRAEKWTWLYVVGVQLHDVPVAPPRIGDPAFVIGDSGRASSGNKRREIPKKERHRTPAPFAAWLVELARRAEARRKA